MNNNIRVYIAARYPQNPNNLNTLRQAVKTADMEDFCFAQDKGDFESPYEL